MCSPQTRAVIEHALYGDAEDQILSCLLHWQAPERAQQALERIRTDWMKAQQPPQGQELSWVSASLSLSIPSTVGEGNRHSSRLSYVLIHCVSNVRFPFKSQNQPIRWTTIFPFSTWRNQNTQREYLTSQSHTANQKCSQDQNPRIPAFKDQAFSNILAASQMRSFLGLCFVIE